MLGIYRRKSVYLRTVLGKNQHCKNRKVFMRFKDFVQMNENFYKRAEIRKIGKNKRGKERILLYATENTDLHDYAICVMDDAEIGTIYRFPNDCIMNNDDYICLFTGNAPKNDVLVNGHAVRTFSMGFNGEIFGENCSVCLIKISNTTYKTVERD